MDTETIKNSIVKLQKRFDSASPIEDTRQYHYFKPINKKTLEIKFSSADETVFRVKIA